IWQELLAHDKSLPKDMPLGELLRLGVEWLAGREDRAEWAHIWQELLAQDKSLPKDMPLGELLRLGADWLAGRENIEEWGFVCEAMLDQRFQASDFIEQVAKWLKSTRGKPEWSLLAAKFIVVAPQHTASADFAQDLVERINARPNSGHWFKTVKLVSNLQPDIVLPLEVHDWLQVLHSRKELPAWAEVRRCLDEGLPIKGSVTAVRDTSCSVELEVGLLAVWPNRKDGLHRAKGLERSFFVQRLNLDREFVQVDLNKPDSLESNGSTVLTIGDIYEGYVTGVQHYGVFLRIGDHRGLLHRSKLSVHDVLAHFSVGQSLRVHVTNIRLDGKLELSLAAH
ncbi:S1 RNA-binding domain-containing protein, partial [Pseudomonas sp.]|uniref:S1 RNA-binding domain-containing protein n=1 Tax=Pseudomonas sp. TaxID=306 RepID=UPI003D11A62A